MWNPRWGRARQEPKGSEDSCRDFDDMVPYDEVAEGRATFLFFREVPVGIAEDLTERVRPVVSAAGVELVEVQFRREGAGWVLRFFLDKPDGIGLEDCAGWSDRLEALVDESGLVTQSYSLEVSSPGLARPLKKREDFERFKGVEVVVKTFSPINNQRNFHGRIEGMDGDDCVILDRTNGLVKVPLANMASARLDPEIPLD